MTDDGRIKYFMDGELVGDVPAESLVLGGGAPQYKREYKEPAYFEEYKKFDINKIDVPTDIGQIGYKLLSFPNITSKRWIYTK